MLYALKYGTHEKLIRAGIETTGVLRRIKLMQIIKETNLATKEAKILG